MSVYGVTSSSSERFSSGGFSSLFEKPFLQDAKTKRQNIVLANKLFFVFSLLHTK